MASLIMCILFYIPVVSGNSIYYIAEKIQNIGISDTLGIYKMDLNGGNKTWVKKFEKNLINNTGMVLLEFQEGILKTNK